MERLAGSEAERQVEAQHLLSEPPAREVPTLYAPFAPQRPSTGCAGSPVSGGHLGEGCLVELLHHAHRDGVECERWFSALDPGRDVLGRGVCLQKGKERLLNGEVARIAGRIDAILAGHSPRSEVGLEEAALVLGQPFVTDGGDVRGKATAGRNRDLPVLEVDAGFVYRADPPAGVSLDPALVELLDDTRVERRTKGWM